MKTNPPPIHKAPLLSSIYEVSHLPLIAFNSVIDNRKTWKRQSSHVKIEVLYSAYMIAKYRIGIHPRGKKSLIHRKQIRQIKNPISLFPMFASDSLRYAEVLWVSSSSNDAYDPPKSCPRTHTMQSWEAQGFTIVLSYNTMQILLQYLGSCFLVSSYSEWQTRIVQTFLYSTQLVVNYCRSISGKPTRAILILSKYTLEIV